MRKMRVLLGVGAAIIGLLVFGAAAFADNGPHDKDGVSGDADTCAACHRAHTASAPKLLNGGSTITTFCYTCHFGGTGAETDVEYGVLHGSTYGTDGAGLRGGGFVKALMDPTHAGGTLALANITSKHNVGEATQTLWGNGAAGSGVGGNTVANFECTSCHNPHGNGNFRILKGIPTDSGTATAVDIADVAGTKFYEINYTATHYRKVSGVAGGYDTPTANDIGVWCGQCHTRYWAVGGSGHNALSGDSVFAYRHTTNGLTGSCFSCHVAHGTSAAMGTYSNAVKNPSGTATAGSRLLTVDNRGVCTQTGCHTSGGYGDLTAN